MDVRHLNQVQLSRAGVLALVRWSVGVGSSRDRRTSRSGDGSFIVSTKLKPMKRRRRRIATSQRGYVVRGVHSLYVQAAIDGEVASVASAQVGERNTTLFKSSASLASLGLREGEIIRYLKPVADGIGLRGSEFYSTVKSGVRTGHANPRSMPCAFRTHREIPDISATVMAGVRFERCDTDASARRAPFFLADERGPAVLKDEVRRHVYLRDRLPVRIKIKRRSGRYSNWYRVTKGRRMWVAGWKTRSASFPVHTQASLTRLIRSS